MSDGMPRGEQGVEAPPSRIHRTVSSSPTYLELARERVVIFDGATGTNVQRRELSPGARLASVRAMAKATGFSKSTIVEAYDRLAAERLWRGQTVCPEELEANYIRHSDAEIFSKQAR